MSLSTIAVPSRPDRTAGQGSRPSLGLFIFFNLAGAPAASNTTVNFGLTLPLASRDHRQNNKNQSRDFKTVRLMEQVGQQGSALCRSAPDRSRDSAPALGHFIAARLFRPSASDQIRLGANARDQRVRFMLDRQAQSWVFVM
jgi:hypothetical protein